MNEAVERLALPQVARLDGALLPPIQPIGRQTVLVRVPLAYAPLKCDAVEELDVNARRPIHVADQAEHNHQNGDQFVTLDRLAAAS